MSDASLGILELNALEKQESGIWAQSSQQPFSYSDGGESEAFLNATLSNAEDLSVQSAALEDAIHDWPSEYHLSYRRSHLFSCFDFRKGASALELGCGCGAITRALGEAKLNVDAIEGSPARANLAAMRCGDLENVRVINENYNKLTLPKQYYDYVFFIGVLEYANRFRDDAPSPREAVCQILDDIKPALKPDGVVVIAIENRLGLKYQLGAGEDHHYKPYIGLYGYPGKHTDQTYSKSEWNEILEHTGFNGVEYLYPFPDYKIPSLVVSDDFLARNKHAATALMGVDSIDHTGYLARIQHEYLHWKTLQSEGQLGTFANSFLICASANDQHKYQDADSCVTGDFAHMSSSSRAREYRTVTRISRARNVIRKTRLFEQSDSSDKLFEHLPEAEFSYVDAIRLDEKWLAALQVDTTGNEFESLVNEYYLFISTYLQTDESGNYLDLVPKNILVGERGDWYIIDQEWRCKETLEPGFLLFRALLTFATENFEYLSGYCRENALTSMRAFLSHMLCVTGTSRDADISRYVELETLFQHQVTTPDFLQPLEVFLAQGFGGGDTTIRVLCSENQTNTRLFENVVKVNRKEDWLSVEVDIEVRNTACSFRIYPGVVKQWFSLRNVQVLQFDKDAIETRVVSFADTNELFEKAYLFDVHRESVNRRFPFYAKTTHSHVVLDLSAHSKSLDKLRLRFEISWAEEPGSRGLKEDLNLHVQRFNQRQRDYLIQNEFLRESLGSELESEKKRLQRSEQELVKLRTELRVIKSSKVWRAAEKFRDLFYKRTLGSVPAIQRKLLSLSRKQAVKSLGVDAAQSNPDVISEQTNTIEIPAQLAVLTTDSATPESPDDIYQRRVGAEAMTEARRLEIAQRIEALAIKPKISIVMPVYNIAGKWLERAVGTVRAQIYKNWELCIVDDCSSDETTIAALQRIRHPQVKIRRLESNRNISAATNIAIEMADGDYVAFMDHDDELSINALSELVEVINSDAADFIYTDEDFINAEGKRVQPHFKPDFSPDLLLSHNYITHFVALKRSLLEQTGVLRSNFDGAQDYDFVLRATELAQRIVHIPKVLYHWRMLEQSTSQSSEAKPESVARSQLVVADALQRRGIAAQVQTANMPHFVRVKRELKATPLVSIVLPFANDGNLLTQRMHCMLTRSTYEHFEVIAVSLEPELPATEAVLLDLELLDSRIKVVRTLATYNVPAALNRGADLASGEHIVFLDLNIDIINWDWLQSFLEHSQRSEVAVVGGKTFSRDGKVHQAGLVIGEKANVALAHAGLKTGRPGYFNRANLIQNVSALPFGFMMCSTGIFEKLNGFDAQHFGETLFDVDFCLRCLNFGFYNIMTPYAQAYRETDTSEGFVKSDEPATRRLLDKHQQKLSKSDPFYSANLSQTGAAYRLLG